jgi:hypothetical protein
MAWMAGFYRTPPVWVACGRGATFTDVDGNTYLDFNVGDMSTVLGYAHPRVTEVITEQAARGVQMFLPVESALAVCEQLRQRFRLPMWQFTVSASTANSEALRIARGDQPPEGMCFASVFTAYWRPLCRGRQRRSRPVCRAGACWAGAIDFNDLDMSTECSALDGRPLS